MKYLILLVLLFLQVHSYYRIINQHSDANSLTANLFNSDPKTDNPTRFSYLTLTITFITNTEINIKLVPDLQKYDINQRAVLPYNLPFPFSKPQEITNKEYEAII